MKTFDDILKSPLPSKIHSDENCIYEGSILITIPDIFVEDTVEKINLKKSLGQAKISIYAENGCVPHFHITQLKKNKPFLCCIKLDCPEYFIHGKYKDTMNTHQLKELTEILQLPAKKDKSKTLWNYLKDKWDASSDNDIKTYAVEMPDYRKTVIPEKEEN